MEPTETTGLVREAPVLPPRRRQAAPELPATPSRPTTPPRQRSLGGSDSTARPIPPRATGAQESKPQSTGPVKEALVLPPRRRQAAPELGAPRLSSEPEPEQPQPPVQQARPSLIKPPPLHSLRAGGIVPPPLHSLLSGRKKPPPVIPQSVGSLLVTVLRAEGLVGTDRGGTSDPFVELSLNQPGPVRRESTPVQKKTLNPSWTEGNTFRLPVCSEDAVLCCEVFDHDLTSRNDFLGEAQLSLQTVASAQLAGSTQHVLELLPRGRETVTGRLIVQAQYDRECETAAQKTSASVGRAPRVGPLGSLRVTVHKATNLPSGDSRTGDQVGSSDPFVRLVMSPSSSGRQMHETSAVSTSLNPIWTAKNVFEFQIEDERDLLFAHVIDADPDEDTDDYLGQAVVQVGEYVDGVEVGQRAFKLTACSDPEGANAGTRPVQIDTEAASGTLGELYLSFIFVPAGGLPKHPLGWAEVQVHRASNLKGVDRSGLSDPFVEVMIDQFGPIETGNTTCIPKTLDPVWSDSESGLVKLELRSATARLILRCCDKDRLLGTTLKNTFLGEAALDLAELIRSPECSSGEQTMPLGAQKFVSNHSKFPPAAPSTPVQGEVTFSVKFVPWVSPPLPLGELSVKVVMAEGLRSADLTSKNDTYVELLLDQAKGSDTVQYKRYRTPTIYNSNAPVWDSTSEFMLRVRDAQAVLFAHCFDEDWDSPDDYLGEASVSVSKFMSSPNVPVLVKLPLGERTEGMPNDDGGGSKKFCCGLGASPEVRGVLTLSCQFFPNSAGLEKENVSLADIKASADDDDWEHVGTKSNNKLLFGCASASFVGAVVLAVLLFVGFAATVVDVVGCMDQRAVNFDADASISRESSCVYVMCATSQDCNAPRGTCVSGTCRCELGFTGDSCRDIQPLFAPRIDGSLALGGGASPGDIQLAIASVQDGVSADDVVIDSFTQNVTGILVVPGVSYGLWASDSAKNELRDALGATAGVSPDEITFTNVEAATAGRRRLQQNAIHRTALTYLISSENEISKVLGNETHFVQQLKREAARVCTVCGALLTEEISSEVVDVVSAVIYHVAPKFADSAQAQEFGDILVAALFNSDNLESAARRSGFSVISSVVAKDFSIAEAFSRVADGVWQQFVVLFERIRPTLLGSSRTIQFGAWAIKVATGVTVDSPITARVLGAVTLGDLLSDVRGLPEGLAAVIDPVRTTMLRNVTVVVITEPVVAVEFSATVYVRGNPTPWRMTAFRTEDEEWDYFTTLRFNALWSALGSALGDSLGQYLDHLEVPELGTVMLASQAGNRRRAQSGLESLMNAFTFKVGALPQFQALTPLKNALATGGDQQLVQQLMLQEIEDQLQEGLAGTIEYKGRLLALSVASTNEEGIRLGAAMTGPPLTVGEALGAAEAQFNEYFATSVDAMAAVTQSALSPLLGLEFANFKLAAKTNPPTLDVTSDISWRGVDASFELSMSKNHSRRTWDYSLMVAWRDLDPLVSSLSEYIDLPTISADAAIMISSATTPRVRVGTWNGDGFDEIALSMPELDLEALGIDTSVIESRLAAALGGGGLQDAPSVPELYEQAHILAGGVIPNAQEFAASRMEEGCSGTFQFRGTELSIYVKSSAEGGFVFGGASRGNAINVGQALGATMQQIYSSADATDLSDAIQSNLDMLSTIEIDGLIVTGRTDPPSLHASGSVDINGVESDFEFSLTKAGDGWEFGFVNQWADSTAIAEMMGLNVTQYVGEMSLGPLALMISSASEPMVQVGQMEPGRRRHLQAANPTGSNLAKLALESQLDLPLVVEMFVQERLRSGVEGTLMLAGQRLSYRVACTTAGWHGIATVDFAGDTAPALSDAMGPAAFDTSGSPIPEQYAEKFQAFLSAGPLIESARLEFWTDPPYVLLAGAASIGQDSELRFSFMAKEAGDGWHFDLAVQTDFLEELWESLPPDTLSYAGVDPTWSPTQVADLSAFAIRIQKSPDDTKFELGTLSPETGEIDDIDLMSVAREFPEFEAELKIEDVPVGSHTVTAVIHASNEQVYLSITKPLAAMDTLTTMIGSSNSQADLAAQTAAAPPQLATFASALNSARLVSLEAHVWADWGDGVVAQLAGDASVLNEPVAFSFLFAADEDASIEWELTVAFDVWSFAEDHLSHIEFLRLDRRRFLQADATARGVIRMKDVAGVKELKIGRATLDGVRGPVPKQHWPAVGQALQASDRLMPLEFMMGGMEVGVYVHAFSGEETGTGVVAQVILKSMVLADVARETLGSAMSDLCPAASSGNSSASMFCQVFDVLLTISVDQLTLEASVSDDRDAPLVITMDARGLSILNTPPLDLMLRAELSTRSQVFGFSAHWDILDFGGMLRGINALVVGGTHVCDMAVFEPFCSIRVQNASLAYVSHATMCDSLSLSTGCVPGLYFVSSMDFPPSFAIGDFTTETLQSVAEGLLGQRLPELTIPIALPATTSMKSLRMKLPMSAIMGMAGHFTAGRRSQDAEFPEIEFGTNGQGNPLMTIRDFKFMMDASSSGFLPGFEATVHLDMTGAAEASGRRLLEVVGDAPHRAPFWPQRRLQESRSGPEPAVVDATIGMLTGAKLPPCGPFVDLEVSIEPPLRWVNPFGIADLSLTLQGFAGGLCFGTGIPAPSRLGLAGGFLWGNYMSGMIFIELELSATASQFFYAEFRCSIEPCTLAALLDTMGTEGLDAVRPFIPAMGVECNNPSCKVSLNTDGLLPGATRTIRDLSSPIYTEIDVPGGLMVDIPGFHFLGQSGYALINIGGSEGFLHAGLRGPLRLPPPLNWLTIGLEMPDFENQLDMVYSPAGVNLAIASRITWGDAQIGANLTLVADPLPAFQLALFVNVPASRTCTFNFAVQASAAMVLDSGSHIGVGGDFTLGATEFNPDVLECMASEMQAQVKDFWVTMLEQWVGSAGTFLANARNAFFNAYYQNNMGLCEKTTLWRTCDPGECRSIEDEPCAGECWCDEVQNPDTCRCACPDNPSSCVNPGGEGGESKYYACLSRCSTPEGRMAARRGDMPPDEGRRRAQQGQDGGVPDQYVTINGTQTLLPTVEDLIDADCLTWATPAKGRTNFEQPATCLRYAHKHARLNALLIRLQMLMEDPVVKQLLKGGVPAGVADKEHHLSSTSRGGGVANRRRKGFGSWAGEQLDALTEAAAEAINSIGAFFNTLGGDFDVIGKQHTRIG